MAPPLTTPPEGRPVEVCCCASLCRCRNSPTHERELTVPCRMLSSTICVAGKLHFVKFETAKVEECIAFIKAKGAYGCLILDAKRFFILHHSQARRHACQPTVCCLSGLHLSHDGSGTRMRVKATGGGAYKFADVRMHAFRSWAPLLWWATAEGLSFSSCVGAAVQTTPWTDH